MKTTSSRDLLYLYIFYDFQTYNFVQCPIYIAPSWSFADI